MFHICRSGLHACTCSATAEPHIVVCAILVALLCNTQAPPPPPPPNTQKRRIKHTHSKVRGQLGWAVLEGYWVREQGKFPSCQSGNSTQEPWLLGAMESIWKSCPLSSLSPSPLLFKALIRIHVKRWLGVQSRFTYECWVGLQTRGNTHVSRSLIYVCITQLEHEWTHSHNWMNEGAMSLPVCLFIVSCEWVLLRESFIIKTFCSPHSLLVKSRLVQELRKVGNTQLKEDTGSCWVYRHKRSTRAVRWDSNLPWPMKEADVIMPSIWFCIDPLPLTTFWPACYILFFTFHYPDQ